MKYIDNFLNRITMYRLVLWYLVILWLAAFIFSFFGWLPFQPLAFIGSTTAILAVALVTNEIFVRVFKAHANTESVYITALILALIITPPSLQPLQWPAVIFLVWVGVWAMSSKFILASDRKHLFNPAAFAVALTAFTLHQSASWWVGGNLPLAPLVLLGGFLVVRKLRRADMVWAFLLAAVASIIITSWQFGIFDTLSKAALHSPVFFFAFIMLTEPLTTPPARFWRIVYGVLVGALFAPALHLGAVYSTPELALLVGNLFSFLVSPSWKEVLTLVEKRKVGAGIYEFVFAASKPLRFRPGQYLEWTLHQPKVDSRGNRRFFTITSSPTEEVIRLAVKFYDQPSSFKRTLQAMTPGDTIAAAQLSGDFVLPRSSQKKLVFIAGGIGVTPFCSMAKYLTDRNESRDIVMFYAAKNVGELAYGDIFEQAQRIGLRPAYIVSDGANIPANWPGSVGRLDAATVVRQVPDYRERTFYLSGPHNMVVTFEQVLKSLGVPTRRVKKDYFPGFA